MLNIRIVTSGAIVPAFLLATGMTVSGALAQTASNETAGKRVLVLQILEPSAAKAPPDARSTRAKPVTKNNVASRSRIRHVRLAGKNRPAPPQAPASEEVWPAADAAAAPPTPLQPPAPPAAAQLGEFAGGHAIQVASLGEVNEIDLPANVALLQANGAPPNGVAESHQPMRDIADAASKSDFAKVVVAQQRDGDVGSTSWILQVLAALGGAVTAGSVAWFLIGSTPQRTYG